MQPRDHDRLRIDIWADVVCPACYLADHRLHTAIERSGRADHIDIVMHAFELHPDTPDVVADNSTVIAELMGVSVAQVEAAEDRFSAVAAADGLPFAVQRKHRNTENIHRVIKLAEEFGVGSTLMTRLQRRAFSGDDDAFDHSTLIDEAVACGVPADRVHETLTGSGYRNEVANDRRTAMELGVRGVPFMVFDGRIAVPGAAGIADYLQLIERSFAEATR